MTIVDLPFQGYHFLSQENHNSSLGNRCSVAGQPNVIIAYQANKNKEDELHLKQKKFF